MNSMDPICSGETTACQEELRLRNEAHSSTRQELEQNIRCQILLNAILQIALEPLPLQQQLRRIFSIMFTKEWMMLDGRVVIYGLKLPEKRGWVRECVHGMLEGSFPDRITNGTCFCGALLPTPGIPGAFEEMPHVHASSDSWSDHLCIPLMCEECVIGLGVFFLRHGQVDDVAEENFCWTLCHVLAGVIRRKRVEQAFQDGLVRLEKSLHGTVDALSATAEMRDPYTSGHQQRVAQLACALGHALGLTADQLKGLHIAGTLHDIGKIAIPAEILAKPGRLSEIEFQLIKGHPQVGYEILQNVEFPWPVARIVQQHHEKLNGAGYPMGLKGEEIVLEARLLAVADVIEAMASHRPYRASLGLDAALEEITQGRGALFDLGVVDACLQLFSHEDAREGWTEKGHLPCLSHWKC